MPRSAAAIARRAAKRGTSVSEQAKADAVASRSAIRKKRQLTRDAGGRKEFAEQRRQAKAGAAAQAEGPSANATVPDHTKRRKRSPEALARREAKRIALGLAAVADAISAPLPDALIPASDAGKRRKRSPEAIARREAKRIALAVTCSTADDGKGKKPEREVWTCSKCGLDGIWGTRFRCRECGQPRYDRKRMDRSWVDPKVAGGWKIEPPSSEKLRQNSQLREMYQKNPEAMSEDDRNRALVLIRRTERKKKKKAKAKAAFLAKKNNTKKKKKITKPRVNLNLPSSMDR